MTARKAAPATAPAGSEDAEAKAAAAAEAKAAEEAAAVEAAARAAEEAAEADAKAAEEAAAQAAEEAAAQAAAKAAVDDQEPQDVTEDEYDSFLGSLSLATAVHVQIDDRYHAFPAGTRIGDVVNGVEFSEDLAGTVTNRKAWVIPTQDD